MTPEERLAAALGTLGTDPARLGYRDPDAIAEELLALDQEGLTAESIARNARMRSNIARVRGESPEIQEASNKRLMESMLPAEDDEPLPGQDERTAGLDKLLADRRRRELSPSEAILADEELQKLGGALRARSRVRRKKRTLEAATRLLGKKPDREFLKEEKPEERKLSRREEVEADINANDAKAFAEAVRKLDMADPASVGDVAGLIDKFLGKVQNAFNTMARTQTDARSKRASAKITELNNLRDQTQALHDLTVGRPRMTKEVAVAELAGKTTATGVVGVLKKIPDAATRREAFEAYKETLRKVVTTTEEAREAKRAAGKATGEERPALGREPGSEETAEQAVPSDADTIIQNIETQLDALEQEGEGSTLLSPDQQVLLDEAKIQPLIDGEAFSLVMPDGAVRPITQMEEWTRARAMGLQVIVSPTYADSMGEYLDPNKARKALEKGTSDMAKAIKMYQGAGEKTYASAFNAMLDQIDPTGKDKDEDFLTRIKRGYGVEDPAAVTKRGEEQKVKLREAQEASLGKLPDTRPTQLTTDEISRRYMQRLDTLTGGKLALADRPERFGMRTLRAQQAAIRGRPDPTKAMRRERFLGTEDEDEDEAG